MITLENVSEFDGAFDGDMKSFAEAIVKNTNQKSFADIPLERQYKEISDMNWISFGHFITLEKMLALDIDSEKKIAILAPLIIRPMSEEYLDNEDTEREKKHTKSIKEMPIGTIYGCFNRFMEKRNKYIFETYNGVIYGVLDEDSEDDDDENDGVVASSGVSARQFHTKKFFWYSLIGTVCDGDIFRRQAAIELPMYEVMPFLAEKRSSQIVENLEAKARR